MLAGACVIKNYWCIMGTKGRRPYIVQNGEVDRRACCGALKPCFSAGVYDVCCAFDL